MRTGEHQTIIGYIEKILNGQTDDRRILGIVCTWLWENADQIGLSIENCSDYQLLSDFPKALENRDVTRELFQSTRVHITKLLGESAATRHQVQGDMTPDMENLQVLFDTLRLDADDRQIFTLFFRYHTSSTFESFVDEMCKSAMIATEIISALTELDRRDISHRLSPEGRLGQSGLLVSGNSTGRYLNSIYYIPNSVLRGLCKCYLNRNNFKEMFIGKVCRQFLNWDDFEHLGTTRDLMADFVSLAIKKRESGINILIWGPPGTGKTEFCKTLAYQIGVKLYSIGEEDRKGAEPSREDRLQALCLAQSLLSDQSGDLLLFDEIDDLIQTGESGGLHGKGATSSKVYMNRLFENNPTPTIWTLNNIALLDEAILRRMSLVIEFDRPPRKNRAAMMERIAERHDLALTEKEINQALVHDVAPAVFNHAARFAKIAERGSDGLNFALRGLSRALGAKEDKAPEKGKTFNPELINADMDLTDLADRLAQQQARQFSLCMYGPPGTGKTEYVRYLANRLGMETTVIRTSDLFGPFVGLTEKAIADVFRKAREQETFLVFDEADSLLSDRRNARQSWQVSQVNEMLTWMECHPMPFACTTNLETQLDPASLRRFTFKCRLGYLLPEQRRKAFIHFFCLSPPTRVSGLTTLTPGDFAIVAQKAKFLGMSNTPGDLYDMLSGECLLKKENPSRSIGF